MVTHLSAYAGIVGSLATEHGLTIRQTLIKISRPDASDLQEFFLEEIEEAGIVVPTTHQMPILLKRLFDLAGETGE